jgi:hypothetical protein
LPVCTFAVPVELFVAEPSLVATPPPPPDELEVVDAMPTDGPEPAPADCDVPATLCDPFPTAMFPPVLADA